jgi:hypothetical protein
MTINRGYFIVHAKRVTTHLGPTVLLTIQDFSDTQYVVYLPKRYARVFSDDDIERISTDKIWLSLIYREFCRLRKLNILDIE